MSTCVCVITHSVNPLQQAVYEDRGSIWKLIYLWACCSINESGLHWKLYWKHFPKTKKIKNKNWLLIFSCLPKLIWGATATFRNSSKTRNHASLSAVLPAAVLWSLAATQRPNMSLQSRVWSITRRILGCRSSKWHGKESLCDLNKLKLCIWGLDENLYFESHSVFKF